MDYCANKIYKKPPEKKEKKHQKKHTRKKKIAVGKTAIFLFFIRVEQNCQPYNDAIKINLNLNTHPKVKFGKPLQPAEKQHRRTRNK